MHTIDFMSEAFDGLTIYRKLIAVNDRIILQADKFRLWALCECNGFSRMMDWLIR